MGHPRLFKYRPALLRHKLREARRISRKVHESEDELIAFLLEFDQHRFFIRAGFRSLRTYCIHGLNFSRTQAQRIVTQVRRLQTTFDIVEEEPPQFKRRAQVATFKKRSEENMQLSKKAKKIFCDQR